MAVARTITVEIPGQAGMSPSGSLRVLVEAETVAMATDELLPDAEVVGGGEATHAGGDPFLGRVLAGRYDVRSVLGEGGYGRVYLAEHVLLGHSVAVKALLPEHAADPAIMARFA